MSYPFTYENDPNGVRETFARIERREADRRSQVRDTSDRRGGDMTTALAEGWVPSKLARQLDIPKPLPPLVAYRKAHPENVVWSPETGWTNGPTLADFQPKPITEAAPFADSWNVNGRVI